jgi:hypothetical protein
VNIIVIYAPIKWHDIISSILIIVTFYQFCDLLREDQILDFPNYYNLSALIEPLNIFVPCVLQIAHTNNCLTCYSVILNHCSSLHPHQLRLHLDVVSIFFDVMRPLIVGLIPHNEILLLTFIPLVSLHRLHYYDFCYFGSYYC